MLCRHSVRDLQELRAKSMRETQTLLKEQDATLDTLHGGIQKVKALGGIMRDELAEQAVIRCSRRFRVKRDIHDSSRLPLHFSGDTGEPRGGRRSD